MRRRKFLIGAGSLAAAGAGAIGTGAVTSVSADRSVDVETASDATAFLSIEPENTPNGNEYVNVTSGTVELDFTSTDSGGSGINMNATTVFDNLLRITNQGTQEVIVGYTHPASPNGNFALFHEDPDLDELEGGNEQGGGDTDGTFPTNDGQLNINTISNSTDLPELQPGETLNNVGAFFFGSPDISAITSAPVTFQAGDDPGDIGL
jgi:Protein of unknown function (DUF1102).